jgi:CheY-like chemotaxis protein
MKKLYLDDLRDTPKGWDRVHTAQECVEALATQQYDTVSLDHDLGENQLTGYDVLAWLEETVQQHKDFRIPTIFIHTDNPVGRIRMVQALQSIWRIRDGQNTNNVGPTQ